MAAVLLVAASGYIYFRKIARQKPAPATNQNAQTAPLPQSQSVLQAAVESGNKRQSESADDIQDNTCVELLNLSDSQLKATKLPAECGKPIDIGKGFTNWKYVAASADLALDSYKDEYTGPALALWDNKGKFIQKIVVTFKQWPMGGGVDFDEDINFDGYKDLKIEIDPGPADIEIIGYSYWIFDPVLRIFHKDPGLEHVENPEFNKNQKLIYSKIAQNNSCFSDPDCKNGYETMYRFADGKWSKAFASATQPKFGDFPAKEIFTGKPAAVDFSGNPQAKKFNDTGGSSGAYRGLLTTETAKGPNFNGRYRLIKWSCGTNCQEVMIVDIKSGHIVYTPFTGDRNRDNSRPDFKPWKNLSFRADSSLMAVNGNYYDVDPDYMVLPYLIEMSGLK